MFTNRAIAFNSAMIAFKRYVVFVLLILALTACRMPDNKVYIFVTPEEYYGMYKKGAIDMCVDIAVDYAKLWYIPKLRENAIGASIACLERVGKLYGRLQDEPPAIEIPDIKKNKGVTIL